MNHQYHTVTKYISNINVTTKYKFNKSINWQTDNCHKVSTKQQTIIPIKVFNILKYNL